MHASSDRIPGRAPVRPLAPQWLIVDQLPLFHRFHVPAGRRSAPPGSAGPQSEDSRGAVGEGTVGEGTAGEVPIVHVHGFGISGTYLEPTAAALASRHPTYVPDLPGMGRSLRPKRGLDLPGLARALVDYLDVVGLTDPVLVGNSLGCPIIIEVAATYPDRLRSAVLVSPAGGPNNQPMPRALRQMAVDGLREPSAMLPIAARDYLRFGALRSLSLFRAMTRYPTLGNLHLLAVPTLVIAGERDPLVNFSRAFVLSALAHVTAVKVPGAHALNFSHPDLIAEIVEAHVAGEPLLGGPLAARAAEFVTIPDAEQASAPARQRLTAG